jgi:hypothetical protein
MCGTFWLTTKSAKFTKRLDFSDFFTFHFLCLIVLRDLRTTVFENSRALRKFTYHHEGHEDHEVRNEILTNLLTFVAFVSFVVKKRLSHWAAAPPR